MHKLIKRIKLGVINGPVGWKGLIIRKNDEIVEQDYFAAAVVEREREREKEKCFANTEVPSLPGLLGSCK